VIRYFISRPILIGGGRYDEAKRSCAKRVALQPASSRVHVHLTTIECYAETPPSALQGAQLEPPGSWAKIRAALGAADQGDRARPMLAAKLITRMQWKKGGRPGPFQIATVYGLRNEPDKNV